LDSPSSPGLRRIVLSAAVLAAIFILAFLGNQPPGPKPLDAPPNQFSAARAVDSLRRILKEDVPHPVGSAEDDAVRQRILDELMKIGYQPRVQTAFACSKYAACATVNNILARLDGSEPGSAVLVSAHYDSVPAGPGDSDDGTGAATVLEIARALKSLPAPRNSVIFLIDEGEEAGLIGAQAFVDSDPWAKEVRVDVNVDNRGTHGPSMMFETGRANDWAIRFFVQHVPHVAADSIAYTVYKSLPNDTDFTVFKQAGYEGMNFAYVKGVGQYHTPLDNSANVSAASVQGHGDYMLPLVAALAGADFANLPAGDAAYFSVFGHWTVHWPAERSLPIACIALALIAAQIVWLFFAGRLSWQQILWGMTAWLVMMIVTSAAALVLARAVHLAGVTPVTFIAYPQPLEAGFALVGIVAVITNGMVFSRRAGFWGLWSGVWAWWSILAVVVSLRAPGLSHMLVVPAAIAACAALPATIRRKESSAPSSLAVLLPLAAAAIVSMSLLIEMYAALGEPALMLIAGLTALLLTPAAPLAVDVRAVAGFRGLAVPWIAIVLGALFLFGAVIVPAYSAKTPERVNFRYLEDADSGKAQWAVEPDSGHLPEAIRLAANFHQADKSYLPWDTNHAFLTDAPHRDLAPPTFTILESSESEGRRTYRALMRSERGAPAASVLFPPDAGVQAISMGGIPWQPPPERVKRYLQNWTAFSCPTMTATGEEISFSAPTGKTIEVSVLDETYGLPPEGAFLLHARPLTASSSQSGDVTLVIRHVQLLP